MKLFVNKGISVIIYLKKIFAGSMGNCLYRQRTTINDIHEYKMCCCIHCRRSSISTLVCTLFCRTQHSQVILNLAFKY